MLPERIYQEIFNELEPFLPTDWEKMIFYFERGESSFEISFLVKLNEGYVDGYVIEGAREDELDNAYDRIANSINASVDDNERWTNMTMVVDREGGMRTDFDYTELTDNAFAYYKTWKERYLK